MATLILELSKFRIPTSNIWKDTSLNTRETKLPSLQSISKRILHRRRCSTSFVPVWSSLPLLLVVTVKKAPQLQHSSLWLSLAIRSGMIAKHSAFIQSVILVPFSSRIFFRLLRLNRFPDFRRKFCSSCLPIAITIARFIGVRHTNNYWKAEEDVYMFGIQRF
jgi:hypothetical protein